MAANRSRTILGLAIGLHVALVLLAGFGPTVVRVPDEWDDLPAALLTVCQMSLVSLWVGFGRGYAAVRIVLALAAGWLCMLLFLTAEEGRLMWPSFSMSGYIETVTAGMILGPLVLVGLPACLVSWAGFRIEWHERPTVHRASGFQFSLRATLFWSVGASVLLGICRWLAPTEDRANFADSPWLFVLIAGLMLASSAFLAVWAALGERSPWVRVAVACGAAPLIGLAVGYALKGTQTPISWILFAGIALAEGVILNATLLAVRAAGYRVTIAGQSEPLGECPFAAAT